MRRGNGEMKGVLWRGSRRRMEMRKFWIGMWMRENEREGGNSWRMREKE